MQTRKLLKAAVTIIAALLVAMGLFLLWAVTSYNADYVLRVLRWRESDATDYLVNFPHRNLQAAPTPFYFDETPAEAHVAKRFAEILKTEDFDAFLQEKGTLAFLVIQDDGILFERYYNGAQRDTLMTSFSVAKSFTSALVGAAIDQGYIQSVDDPITDYLPELAARDERFASITIRQLLMMASGLDYQEMRAGLFNGDDPLTTYFPDQRQIALENTQIIDPPGVYFRYNKYHPQLLGLILERTTGESVSEFMQNSLWNPLGMEFGGSWSLDSEASGFEKMEAGINARAIDYAKLGRLYLENGRLHNVQVLPAAWIETSTQPSLDMLSEARYRDDFGRQIFDNGQGYYAYMWYGKMREDEASDFAAEGDHGQIIYVSPKQNLIIVRLGTTYGISMAEWLDTFYQFAGPS